MNGTCVTRPGDTNTRLKRKFISHSNKNILFMVKFPTIYAFLQSVAVVAYKEKSNPQAQQKSKPEWTSETEKKTTNRGKV